MTPGQIGRYEILSEIGRGGMATVYHAHDPRFKRDVAVKVLPPQFLHDPTFRARFEREAQIIASIEHPAIVPVYDFGEEDGQLYLVMRFMGGGTLSDRLGNGPLTLDEAAKILSRLAPALDEVHRRGIIHRDLKPSNILFDRYDEAYLTDFGIAHLTESTSALTGSAIVGTPAYMSPEQAQGEVELDGRSDIYALGAILFEILTGKQPYQATTPMGVLLKHLSDPVPRLLDAKADLPLDCQTVISKAMAKNREERYNNAAEMAGYLEAIAKGQSSLSEKMASQAQKSSAPRSQPGVIAYDQKDLSQPAPIPENRSLRDTGSLAASPRPKRVVRSSTWIWIIIGAIIIGLCGIVGLLSAGGSFLLRSSTALAPLPTQPYTSPSAEVSPQPIINSYEDTFSNKASGWVHSEDASSETGYDASGYRIFVEKPQSIVWATPGLDFSNVSIDVKADKIAGPDDNYFGIICRFQDEANFYLLAVSSDGYYSIGKYKDGIYTTIGKDGSGYSETIHQGKTRNRLRADCIQDTLTLYANGTKLAQVEDLEFTSGDVGLLAATLDVAGTNILFDDFQAQVP